MNNILISFFAYLIDKFFGEFSFIKHPIIIIGELISFFEKRFYKDSISRGLFLVLFVIASVSFVTMAIMALLNLLDTTINLVVSSFIASMFLAHKMLYDSVKNILICTNKREAISMLVSRDTKDMSESDIYKASIETYGENLSDGVVAPLLYLICFGLGGIVVYKAINTMDSMVGYRNIRYENYGKVAAIVDDIVNWIPSRITALLIMLIHKKSLFSFYKDGKKHDSPNAGHPITAMAISHDISLGGDCYYFGKLKKKAYFGSGRKIITSQDLKNVMSSKKKIDLTVLIVLFVLYILFTI